MKLTDFLDAQGIRMQITYYPNQDNRWCARFEDCSVVEGGFLRGAHGNAQTPAEAIRVYLKDVRGKEMKLERYHESRYFKVPQQVEYTWP